MNRPVLYAALGIALTGITAMHAHAQTPYSPAGATRGSDGQVILITGSTDGLGREVARRLAADGHHVIVHGRNRERGHALVDEIAAGGRGSASFHAADFASLDEVRAFAATINREYDRLDVLVNNAGIWARGDDERHLSADGHEMQFAVNYLAGYLLTHELLPLLRRSEPARIVNVASAAQTAIDFDDPMMEQRYAGSRGYAQSKLAQVIFTFDLAEQDLAGTGVTATALHPSTLMDTRMVRGAGVAPRTTVDEGARAVLRLITDPDIPTGTYFNVLQPARAHDQAYDPEARRQLRMLSDRLTGRTPEK